MGRGVRSTGRGKSLRYKVKKFLVKTLGCKANYSDGQLLEVGLQNQGFSSTHDLDEADLVVVNSCTVTDEADKQSQKLVKDIYKKNPNAKIIYTGCGAEVNPAQALKIKGVSAVIGNQNKDQAATLIKDFFEKSNPEVEVLGSVSDYGQLLSKHPMDREWPLPESEFSSITKLNLSSSTFRTRSFLKIQEGCDSFCTYCIIPYGRGPARSLPIDTIVNQISELVKSGVKEVVLTGTNIGDYGIDLSGKLQIDDLMEAILVKTGIERLRVSSLDPTEISDRMLELLERHENFCPHFHVSLQNVSSKILKLMKRKYDASHVVSVLGKLSNHKRRPFVGMDYITGFPGETDDDFLESMEVLKTLYWSRLHVFPYSEREGTPATRLPNKVPPSTRKARARMLQELSLERLTKTYAETRQTFTSNQSGLIKGILLEGKSHGPDGTKSWISGYAPNYQRVLLPLQDTNSETLRNEVVSAQVSRWIVDRASGEVSWIGEWSKDGAQ